MPLLLAFVDWGGLARRDEPRLVRAFRASSPLSAGAARVELSPPLPLVRPGFRYPRVVASKEQEPLQIRAVVLRAGGRSLAVVLADLLVITDQLQEGLEARLTDLGLDSIVLLATHTHSSVGGFDSHVAAQVLGLGRYRGDVVKAFLDHAEGAVRGAQARAVPVHVYTAHTRIPGWAWNRSTPGGEVDDALTVALLRGEDGRDVAMLAVVAAHPTLFPRSEPRFSPDYPGVAMGRLEAQVGVAMLLQGAEGDAAAPGDGWLGVQNAGAFVAQRVAEAARHASPAPDQLAVGDVRIDLPSVDVRLIHPFLLRRPASNVLSWFLPHSARVGLLRIGDLRLLTLPGEPTDLAAREMVAALPGDPASKTRVVALARGYVSYIDTRRRVEAASGEGRRAWYGADLLPVVIQGLRVAIGKAEDQTTTSRGPLHSVRPPQ